MCAKLHFLLAAILTSSMGQAAESPAVAQPAPSALSDVAPPLAGLRRTLTVPINPDSLSSTGIAIPQDISKWQRLSYPQTVIKPPNWPSIPWEPRRYTGPFKKGSDFSKIRVAILGTPSSSGSGVAWAFNLDFGDYFAGVDPAYTSIYKRYFLQLPQSAAAFVDANANPYSTVLTLQQISYSSRFGGTVEFEFQQSEDYGLELLDDSQQKSWDSQNQLRLWLYVPIDKGVFNSSLVSRTTVYAIVDAGPTTAYVKNNNTWVRADAVDGLEPVEQSIAAKLSTMNSATIPPLQLTRFAYGFVHASILETFDYSTEKITSILVSDNDIAIETEKKKPYALVYFKMEDVSVHTDVLGGEELAVDADNFLAMGNDKWIAAALNVNMGNDLGGGENTPWKKVAQLSPEEIDFFKGNGGLWTALSMVERDPLGDDLFFANVTYKFAAITGANLVTTLQNRPADQKIDEQWGGSIQIMGPVFMFRYKVVAALR